MKSTYNPSHTRPVYPTLTSTQEVFNAALVQLPITTSTELHALLMTYHNTVLNEQRLLEQSKCR